ncbi:MAG: GNAT family N-acetyltransferase [Ruminococcus sp.]|uniref:GNAT family N-acetyltransferase n=1 Tax=Ruminococcus sp. TaxID=41978 RepID=UPI0025F2B56A|nr:GNAT family N-acetyltransferase [Ruminococcus sp.]MCR5600618.1 GNAT family N-acetyltransferase [Ruminococcus sp.]
MRLGHTDSGHPSICFVICDNYADIEVVLNSFQNELTSLRNNDEFRHKMALKLAEYACFLVVKIGDEVAGFVAVYANDVLTRTAYIPFIAVDPAYRGKGVGRLLFDKACDLAIKKDMLYLKLEVNKSNNNAIAFYNKMGMRCIGEASQSSFYYIKKIGDYL